MSSPNRRSTARPLSTSRSLQQSLYAPGASSRPFLNMLNPLGRTYQGYAAANQSVLEEDEETNSHTDDDNDLEAQAGRSTSVSRTGSKPQPSRAPWGAGGAEMSVLRPNIRNETAAPPEDSESDDEVPQSFMIESPAVRRAPPPLPSALRKGKAREPPRAPAPPLTPNDPPRISVPPRPSEINVERVSEAPSSPQPPRQPMRGLDAYERALWDWVNVYNLDAFLQEVYDYYEGKGIYSIALARGLNLLTVGFVIGFSTFLLRCVDYSRIRPEEVTRLSDVVVDHCVSRISGFSLLFFLLFCTFYLWQIVSFVRGTIRLVDMYRFYTHLLRIPDEDIQTISWPEIVRRIGAIRESNPLTAISSASRARDVESAKLDAHDVANRVMRQENFLISLFNKELLDLRVPFPHGIAPEEGKGRTLTRTLEWNLRFCLMEYLFDSRGRVRKIFLKSKNRAALIEGLRRRFIFMGILNAIFAPLIVLYLLMYSFFRYFEEYHKNPSSIGGRTYTPFARWKFREFNELPHLFKRRLDESYPIANMYIGQFPNRKLELIMRFVAFIAGSFAAVLLLASVLDPDLFLHFEITPRRTVLFYLSIFTGILAVARGMIPEENRVFDSEALMLEVVQYTHYLPDEWRAQLHSRSVHAQFGELFAMKILIFASELVSVVVTPLILWYSLPPCAPAIIDFFREFTVHVDGLGYVCSFAVFDFQRHGNVKFGAPTRAADERLMSNEGKMEKSILSFKAAHPDWMPSDPSSSLYLHRMADYSRRHIQPPPLPPPTSPPPIMTDTVQAPGDEQQLAARAREYERALHESQSAALARRRFGASSMMLGQQGAQSTLGASGIFQSAMARTAVLGDSDGSIAPPTRPAEPGYVDGEDGEDAVGSGVRSGLGESYVDGGGRGRRGIRGGLSMQEEEDEGDAADGGVLGLLAQIYSGKGRTVGRVM
ncbi:APG9-domain-containing protein [Auriscalpium vulgare]|uniref:APG9-domain-containing protein n=1 Tax=Auriscalpium vulgare TaxID=40419 RepID=A0ACB8R991_9AGAM|nr:APG9-domain-containing protein [Auriscalpium vulgare]